MYITLAYTHQTISQPQGTRILLRNWNRLSKCRCGLASHRWQNVKDRQSFGDYFRGVEPIRRLCKAVVPALQQARVQARINRWMYYLLSEPGYGTVNLRSDSWMGGSAE